MGGKASGRRRDPECVALAGQLRAKGMTMAAIGKRLGLTKQAVHVLLTQHGQAQVPPSPVPCVRCGAVVTSGYFTLKQNRNVLCLACVERDPETQFGVRLKAFRLAAGMTQRQVAERTGIHPQRIADMEFSATANPTWGQIRTFVRVFGPGIVCLGITAH
jgi:DNA-binding XRE family transcriptional regulator